MEKYEPSSESEGKVTEIIDYRIRDDGIITRRGWLKIFGVALGAIGVWMIFPKILNKLVERDPEAFERVYNTILRRNKELDIENIDEKIERCSSELEKLVNRAIPISTFEDLDSVRKDLKGNYKLVNDIYCPERHNFEPIGSHENPFLGTLNGQGHTIHNLNINWPERDFVGLIGSIGWGPAYLDSKKKPIRSVSNLSLNNIKVCGRVCVGKLVGYNNGFVANCYANGFVKGDLIVGGISGMGSAEGILLNCSNKGRVKGNEKVGGVIGSNNQGYVVNCLPNDEIEGKENVGTLIGYNDARIYGLDDFSEHVINSPGTIGRDIHPKRQ